jgi:hypothetical protein
MLFTIRNNYGHVYDDLGEKLTDFNFNYVDFDKATIEINSMEELVKLTRILGNVLVTEDHITYFVD